MTRPAAPFLLSARFRRGVTLVELLVAALIVAVGLLALVSTWIAMTNMSLRADERTSAFEAARSVLERARSFGFTLSDVGAASETVSVPAPGNPSTWRSACLQRYRYFDADLNELSGGGNNLPGTPPSKARFLVKTAIGYSPVAEAPLLRDDLRLMTVTVTVRGMDAAGNAGTEDLARLQTALSQGGL